MPELLNLRIEGVKRKLCVPSNVSLLHLPPGSPELNPTENVWQFVRQNYLSNRVFGDYDAVVRPPPQLGASSSPSPVVSHLSRPEAGPISVRAHEVWYNPRWPIGWFLTPLLRTLMCPSPDTRGYSTTRSREVPRNVVVPSSDIFLHPVVVGLDVAFKERLSLLLVFRLPCAKAIMIINVEHMNGVCLRQSSVAANDQQVLVILMGCFEPKIMATCRYHSAMRLRSAKPIGWGLALMRGPCSCPPPDQLRCVPATAT